MRKSLYACAAMGLAALTMSASQLTPAEALNAAKLAPSSVTSRMLAPSRYRLATTIGSDDFNACYVFNSIDGKGFVIVAADDVVTPVLGYSTDGHIDPLQMPENLREMLDSYHQQIKYAAAHPEAAASAFQRAAAKAPATAIAPLCSTRWDQDYPYNLLCPTIDNQKCMTGCVATAMAQVMKVHNYPSHGTGSKSYSYSTSDGQRINVSSNFSAHTYDWDNMTDTYGSSSTQAECDAVAQLIFDVGVASEMAYHYNASGSTTYMVGQAIINNFGYDRSVSMLYRRHYYIDKWIDMVYNELKEGRPVYMSGRNSMGGHAFVCDGYSSDNFFHINWGWSGLSNGYYMLTLLDPDQQGIGGSPDGYTEGASALFGVKPGNGDEDLTINVANEGGFYLSKSSYSRFTNIPLGASSVTKYINNTLAKLSGTLGVKLVNVDTDEVTYAWSTTRFDNVEPGSGYTFYYMQGTRFPESGSYIVTPAFKTDDGDCYDFQLDIAGPQGQRLTVNGSNLEFSPIVPEGETTVTELLPIEDFYVDQPFAFKTVTTTTTPEFMGNVQVRLLNSNGAVVANGITTQIDVARDTPLTTTWISAMTPVSTITPGTHTLEFRDTETSSVLGSFNVEVKESLGTLTYEAGTFAPDLDKISGRWLRSNPAVIFSDTSFKVKIPVTQGILIDEIYLSFVYSSGEEASRSGGYLVCAKAGETAEINFSNTLLGLPTSYTFGLLIKGAQTDITFNTLSNTSRIWFQVSPDGPSGVESVDAEADSQPAEYFNLQGVKIAQPVKGQMVIRRQGGKATKMMY